MPPVPMMPMASWLKLVTNPYLENSSRITRIARIREQKLDPRNSMTGWDASPGLSLTGWKFVAAAHPRRRDGKPA
jgi:hypothetical protein